MRSATVLVTFGLVLVWTTYASGDIGTDRGVRQKRQQSIILASNEVHHPRIPGSGGGGESRRVKRQPDAPYNNPVNPQVQQQINSNYIQREQAGAKLFP